MSHPASIAYDEAAAILRSLGTQRRLPATLVSLSSARGMVLAGRLEAPIDLPPFGLVILSLQDPDGINLELAAPRP